MPFTATVNSTEEIVEDMDEEKDLVESKFEKMDEQDDIYTAYVSYIRSRKSMRSCIGWLPISSMMWSLNEKKSS